MSNRQALAPGAVVPAPQQQQPVPYQQPAPAPYGYQPQYVPVPYPPPGPPPLEEILRRECEQCGKYIHEGEESVELFEGIERRSEQTGYGITQPYPNDPKARGLVTLHRGSCSMEYMMETVCPDEADEVIYEMAMESAELRMQEYLDAWHISWEDLETLLRNAGHVPDDESEEQAYRDRVAREP